MAQPVHTLDDIWEHLEAVEKTLQEEAHQLETVSKKITSPSRLQVRNPEDDAIKAGTLRITWISGIIAALVAVGSTWGSLWDAIYGQDPSMWVKTAVLITIIASWAVIAASDIHARAIASKK